MTTTLPQDVTAATAAGDDHRLLLLGHEADYLRSIIGDRTARPEVRRVAAARLGFVTFPEQVVR